MDIFWNPGGGDSIEASAVFIDGAYELAVKDLTNKRQFATRRKCGQRPCNRIAAEWVIERPGGRVTSGSYENFLVSPALPIGRGAKGEAIGAAFFLFLSAFGFFFSRLLRI